MQETAKFNIGWGPITTCNMKCQFCYSKDVRNEREELKYHNWETFINENHDKINSINYGTGENSISDDWFKLIKYVSSNYHIKQALTTNGYVSERMKENMELDKIFEDSISEVDVSVDFGDKKSHNTFRGQEKAYDWAINTLEYCADKDIDTTIVFLGTNTTLDTNNLEGLFELSNKYKTKIRMNLFRPTMKNTEHRSKFIASYDNIIKSIEYINKNYKILSISDPLFSSILTSNHFEEDPSGKNSLRILADGSITPSTYLITENFIISNIQNKNPLNFEWNKIDEVIPSECLGCKYCSSCKGGVYDRRFLWYDTFSTSDPYCPFRDENYEPDFKVDICNDSSFTSIHHGYLPTMFFKA